MEPLTQPQCGMICSAVSVKEDTGWIISLGPTDPSCWAKNTSHCIILSGFTVSVSNSAPQSGGKVVVWSLKRMEYQHCLQSLLVLVVGHDLRNIHKHIYTYMSIQTCGLLKILKCKG